MHILSILGEHRTKRGANSKIRFFIEGTPFEKGFAPIKSRISASVPTEMCGGYYFAIPDFLNENLFSVPLRSLWMFERCMNMIIAAIGSDSAI